jgi:uncharacterized LabA/DUF88 family protein
MKMLLKKGAAPDSFCSSPRIDASETPVQVWRRLELTSGEPRRCRIGQANRATSMSPAKIMVLIDGPNLYAATKVLGFDIDYKRLLKEFGGQGVLVRALYYTAVMEDQEYSSIRPLVDWLDYNGYTVVTKGIKEFVDDLGRRKVKGNMAVEIAVDAMELAERVDEMILFLSDGGFRSLVEAVQRRGVRVTVASTAVSRPPMVADELRRQADVFIDLVELQSRIGRAPPTVPREDD